MITELELPYPPSVNALFRNRRGGRAKTKAYDAWIYEAGVELMRQRPRQHLGAVAVIIRATPPDRRRRDLDNLFKPLLDILCKHQVIQDDDARYVQDLRIRLWRDKHSGITVYIRDIEQIEFDSIEILRPHLAEPEV